MSVSSSTLLSMSFVRRRREDPDPSVRRSGSNGRGAAMLSPISEATGLSFRLGSVRTAATAEASAASNAARVSSEPNTGVPTGTVAADADAGAPAAGQLSCFPAGTPVLVHEGARPIESIAEGQPVWGYDLVSSVWQLRRVLRTYSRLCEGLAASLTVAGETIVSTSRHPFLVIRGEDLDSRPRLGHLAEVPKGATTPGRWVDAADLRVGDELVLLDSQVGRVDQIQLYPFFDRVYNFEVDDLHCYAVGQAGILVHNNNGAEIPVPGRPANLSPPNSGRSGAFNQAKRNSGIPTSQQPDRVLPNLDRRGNLQPGRVYEFDVPAPGGGKQTIRIRDDAGGHNFGPGDPQNRGPHFNDQAGGHYDY